MLSNVFLRSKFKEEILVSFYRKNWAGILFFVQNGMKTKLSKLLTDWVFGNQLLELVVLDRMPLVEII